MSAERVHSLLAPERDRDPHTWTVVAISAIVGGLLGLFVYPAPQYTLEPAQVIAGVVDLPRDNPMRIFDTSAYSLFSIQLPALLLAGGVSESSLSLLLSAVQGATAFSAVALVSLSVSRLPAVALLTPLLLLHIPIAFHKYRVAFPNSEHNGPLLGFYAFFAAISLIALRKERSGSFLLGLLPAFNPVLGAAGWLAAGVAVAAERVRYWPLLRRTWPYVVAGAGLFAVTFAFQMLAIRDVSEGIAMESATSLTTEFIRNLDPHRRPYFESGISTPWDFFEVDAAFVLLAALLLTKLRPLVPSSARLLLIGLLTITFVATTFTVIDELAPGFFPLPVKSLMITRWLNWNALAFPVVVISLLGYLALRHRSIVALLALPLALVPLRSTLAAVALGIAVLYTLAPRLRAGVRRVLGVSYRASGSGAVAGLAVLACAVLFGDSMSKAQIFELDQGDPVWAETRQDDGLVIVAPQPTFGFEPWTQLRAERGLVLDPARLDVIPYAPRAAPATEAILNAVYGTSIRDPAKGQMLFGDTERVWEGRTAGDWQSIGEAYGATDVLVSSSWDLQLPLTTSSDVLRLYHIPNQERTGGVRSSGREGQVRGSS